MPLACSRATGPVRRSRPVKFRPHAGFDDALAADDQVSPRLFPDLSVALGELPAVFLVAADRVAGLPDIVGGSELTGDGVEHVVAVDRAGAGVEAHTRRATECRWPLLRKCGGHFTPSHANATSRLA